MYEEIYSLKEVIEMYINTRPDSMVSKLVKLIGVSSVAIILEDEDFQNKPLYLVRSTSLVRAMRPLIIQKRLKALTGNEREEMVKKLSNFFGVSKRVILKMYTTGKHHRN
jgi:hypothetical protein